MKKIIATEHAPAAIGPYSQAVEKNGTLYISGQLPVNPASGSIEAQDIQAQTKQALTNLKSIVEEAGLTLNNVVKCTCLLDDISEFKAMNEVYASFFTDTPPARAAFEVAALPLGAKIEIEAIAIG